MRKGAKHLSATPLGAGGGTSIAVTLMEHLVVPTFVLDAERKVLIWNRACERLTGVKATDVIGTRDHWRAFYDDPRPCLADLVGTKSLEQIETLYTTYQNPAELSFAVHAENWCLMPRLGQRLYLAVDAGPIYDDAGNLVAIVETLRDMTDKKNAEDALQRLATQDGLTGVGNRRAFDEALKREWRRAQRLQMPLGMVLVDVDCFKQFNDIYGHLQGDACLRSVAAVMADNAIRTGDLAARYGGEEFALLLPFTEIAGALALAERVRSGVRALWLPHSAGVEGQCVTISAGAASMLPGGSDEPEQLIGLADAALYRAKKGGRNRVETV